MKIVFVPILNFVLFMVSYTKLLFTGNLIFDKANIGEDTTIPRILSVRGKRFFLHVTQKNITLKNSQMTPLHLLKIFFRNFVLLTVPEVIFGAF
jgi:hypothetical protein